MVQNSASLNRPGCTKCIKLHTFSDYPGAKHYKRLQNAAALTFTVEYQQTSDTLEGTGSAQRRLKSLAPVTHQRHPLSNK